VDLRCANLRKISGCEVYKMSSRFEDKKTRQWGFVRTPILSPLSRLHPNFPERCRPLICACLPNLFWMRVPGVIPNRLLFQTPIVIKIGWSLYTGLQRTIKLDGSTEKQADEWFHYAWFHSTRCVVRRRNRASAYGTPLDGATVKVVITTVNKT